MGKKRAAAGAAAAEPEPEPDHFSDCGYEPQLLQFFSQPEVKRLWGNKRQRHHQHQPAQQKPLESARFKLQKPISKKHHHNRLWWSSAASAALHLFKKRPSSARTRPAAAPSPPPGPAASTAVPLYIADCDAGGDGGGGGGAAACSCWAPAVRSGRLLAADELGAAALAVPYVSLRSTGLGVGGGGGTGGAPVMPIYLVT